MGMIDDSTLTRVFEALSFAAYRHRNQRRKGAGHMPYINHLIDVVDLLWRVGGVRDGDVLTAAALHDTIEDTGSTAEEIEAAFGPVVRGLVLEVTDDKSLSKQARKQLQEQHAAQLSDGAKCIKLADKISNVRDARLYPPEDWSTERREEYLAWAARVVTGLRGINPALEAEFERVLNGA
jgi:guanosine-3',5'-bis(diphosphate) 3'-pyrophosphohydrolase